MTYEKYKFSKRKVEHLIEMGFPIKINSDTEIIELHINFSNSEKNSLIDYRNDFKTIANNLNEKENSYIIGVTWLKEYLEKLGFSLYELNPGLVDSFGAGQFINNKETIIKDYLDEIERLESRQNITVEDNNIVKQINTLSETEKVKLDQLKNEFTRWQKVSDKLEGNISKEDVRMGVVSYKDFINKFKE